jgi:hypothetical protein
MTKVVTFKVTDELYERFREHARAKGGTPSSMLQGYVVGELAAAGEVLTAETAEPQVKRGAFWFRLSDAERAAITEAAMDRGMSVSELVRSVMMTHITRRPRFSSDEADALRNVAGALRQVCRVLDRMNGDAAAAAGQQIRTDVLALIKSLVSGGMDYWLGGDDAEEPEIELAAD